MTNTHFTDGALSHKMFGDQFYVPPPAAIDAIVPGDRIKIGLETEVRDGQYGGERFWLEVTDVEGAGPDRRITGELIDALIVFDIELGEEFTVEARHVLDIDTQ